MPKSTVICADGTGNTSTKGVSNVYRLLDLITLDAPSRQLVIYDQGIGTPRAGLRGATTLARSPGGSALRVLPGPLLGPSSVVVRPFELAFGAGLYRNVKQLYEALAHCYEEGDTVYLFGFSRGAFTARALAGLLHRCGLGQADAGSSGTPFREIWQRYTPMTFDRAEMSVWRERCRRLPCPIHFLGLWDTVKSYGGLRPVMLPHLRHNPTVTYVRHAIALDEKRGWFNVTTWGRLDSDRNRAMTRLEAHEREAIERQDILEVWFRGCHSDIGGGDEEEVTARIARQWMLGEARRASSSAKPGTGLSISGAGASFLGAALPKTVPKGHSDACANTSPRIHESLSRFWSAVDLIPRLEIDNSGVWPCRRRQKQDEVHAYRSPELLLRQGVVTVHESVGDLPFGRAACVAHTYGPNEERGDG